MKIISNIKFKLLFLIGGLLMLFSLSIKAQSPSKKTLDSLLVKVNTSVDDTEKVNNLLLISKEYSKIDENQNSLRFANTAQTLAKKLNYKKGIAKANHRLGFVNKSLGNFTLSLQQLMSALAIYQKINYKAGIAECYIDVGNVYRHIGNIEKALDCNLKALTIYEETFDTSGMGKCYLGIAHIYITMSNYDYAFTYYNKGLSSFEKINDSFHMALAIRGLGSVYMLKHDKKNALECCLKATLVFDRLGNKAHVANCYFDMTEIYLEEKNFTKALESSYSSLEICKEIGDKQGIAISYGNLGVVYFEQKDYAKAENLLKKALEQFKEMKYKEGEENAYQQMARLYYETKKFEKAYECLNFYSAIKDSLLNESSSKQIAEMNAKYESEKKDKEIKLLTKDNEVREAEISKQRVIKNSILLGLVLVLLFAFALLNRFYITRKQKKIIEFQKQEVEEQKIIIEEKNKSITDSINYAQGIQKAILPHRRDIWAAFPNSFVFYKPKDIVSGDFYFFSSVSDFVHLIAVVDCTGHGIPGGFMTMLCSEKLTAATQQTQSPDEILSVLNKGVKQALKQSHESDSSKDGMDIALCLIDTLNKTVKYSGANRPLWILKKDTSEIHEIKATKKAIAGFTEDDQKFELHSIPLQEGDSIFLSTDGYADLFNVKGKKIGSKQFKLQLAEIQKMPLKQQGRFLEKYADQWAAGVEQTDDILVIGFRL